MSTVPVSWLACVALSCMVLLFGGCAASPAEDSPAVRAQIKPEVRRKAAAPDPVSVALARGDAAQQGSQFYEALRQYIVAAELEPKTDVPLLRIAALHESQGQLDLAIRALQLAALRDLHHGLTPQRLGFLWLQVGDDENAVRQFKRALQLDPTLWASCMGLGLAAERRADLIGARLHYDEALALQPASAELLAYSARAELAAGNQTRARELADRSLAVRPSGVARLVVGDLVAESGDYSGALDAYLVVLTMPSAYKRLGDQAMQRRDFVAAIGFFESAVRTSPTYFEAAEQRLEVAREHMATIARGP